MPPKRDVAIDGIEPIRSLRINSGARTKRAHTLFSRYFNANRLPPRNSHDPRHEARLREPRRISRLPLCRK
jgi:hypothetical protein